MLPDPSWNDTSAPYPQGESIHGIFAAHAAARPDAPCLIHSDGQVSYGVLDRAAAAYAMALGDTGVGPGDLVPIRLPRGPQLIATVLATLKLGAAYALIDRSWPRSRVEDVLEQLEAKVLVDIDADSAWSTTAEGTPVPVWTPLKGGLASVAQAAPPGFTPAEVSGQDPACVFFTSGTTGRPKGVLCPHRATARLFRPGTFAHFAEDTVMPQAAPVPWDGYSLELWSVLLNGGASVIVDEPYISSDVLRTSVAKDGTDTVWLTSSLFNMLMDEDPECLRGLRQVMIGGERLSVRHVRGFLARYPDTALFNGYGPVESTVFATVHRITPDDCDRPSGIPIGRPVPDTQVYILDGQSQCQVGETGELCIAGHGLALRYLGRPELTAEKFTEVTVEGTTVRVYRTGDLAHWDDNGLLHYSGRADRQVKIRGHRIEPAEVERQIEQLPEVRRCTVVALRDESGATHALAAFCQPSRTGDSLDGTLDLLRQSMVHYQLPEYLLSVDDYPLTANGKLDESALLALLPQPDKTTGLRETPHVSSGDPLTSLITDTIADVVGLPAVPPDIDFTELGASSLDTGRVCARLAAKLQRPVPVSALIRTRTAQALADWLAQDAAAEGHASGELQNAEIPLTGTQSGFLIRQMLDPADRAGHCMAAWVIDGHLDRTALRMAVEDVHRRHASLGAAYRLGRGQAFSVPGEISAPDIVVLDGHATAEEALEAVRISLGESSLDPVEGPLWRVTLAPVDPETTVLGYAVHHIAFDGWSEAVIAADLAAAYNDRQAGRELSWPPVLSAAEAHALRAQYLRAADTETQRDAVAARLRGVPELRFPQRPMASEPAVQRTEVELGAEAGSAIGTLAKSVGQTRFAVLLSCYARALAKTTGQIDFGIGVPVAQRIDERMERVVGCHIGTICLRITQRFLDNDIAISAAEAGRLSREALSCQDIGIDEIARAVNPPRSPRSPFFQTLFAYQDNVPPVLDFAGCSAEFRRLPYAGLPTEIQTEVWPTPDGGLRVVVSSRNEVVDPHFAQELAQTMADLIAAV